MGHGFFEHCFLHRMRQLADGVLLACMNSAFTCVNRALHLFACRCSPTVFHGSPLYHAVTASLRPAQRGRVKWRPGCRTPKRWIGVQKVSSCLGDFQSEPPSPKLMEIKTTQPPASPPRVTWPFLFLSLIPSRSFSVL